MPNVIYTCIVLKPNIKYLLGPIYRIVKQHLIGFINVFKIQITNGSLVRVLKFSITQKFTNCLKTDINIHYTGCD